MAILDAKTVFANDASIVGTAGSSYLAGSTVWSGAIAHGATQIVDQGKAGDAVGQELTLKVVVGSVAITGSGATLQVKLQTSDTTTAGDFKDVILSPVITVGGMKKGTSVFECRIPPGTKRYLRTVATIGTANITGGSVSIFATRDL